MAEDEKDQNEANKTKARVNLQEPSEELLKWASENINENPDKRDLLISELKDMIYEKGECTPTRTDDEFLLRFLRARYFVVKVAHRLYVSYHNFREEEPQYFENVNLEKILEIVQKPIFNCPPNTDHLGRRMLIFNIGEWVPSAYTPTELLQFVIFLIQITALEPQTQIKGAVLLINLSGLSLEMVWYLTPTLARHLVTIAMSSFPVRLQAVHFLYSSWTFDTAFSMIKVLIPERVRDRIFFHIDLGTLYDKVNPKCLPKSLGGGMEDYPLEKWIKEGVLNDERVLTELEKIGYPIKKFILEKKILDVEVI